MNGHPIASTPYYGLFNDSFPPIIDGVTLTVENYARCLGEMGFNPCVVTPWNPEILQFPYQVIRYFSLPIHSRKPYRYGYPKMDPFIWKKMRDTPFRLVHSHCPFSSGRLGVYVKKHQHVPLIGTFHSKYKSDLSHSFKYAPWCVSIILKRIINFFNSCDEVWIPQASVEDTVREYGYKGHLEVVENGVDYAGMPSGKLKKIKLEARNELGIDPDKIALLFVGQHIWEKGIGMIADCLNLLGDDVPFTMNFIGNGYALGALRSKIKDLGLSDRVTIHGIISDRGRLSRYYAASDLFLFPSFYDNAPLVVREAAALGTPAIILKGSTASEVITPEVNGFLVDNSANAYADKIKELSGNRERLFQVGVRAGSTIVRSWDDIVKEVVDRYESLIKRTSH